jgi:CRISPR-associated protein Csh2
MGHNNNSTIQTKSEILFLYESTYTIPNGDPFTGEQRYDEETKKILVSDVRIKRYIRDYLIDKGQTILVSNPNPDNKLTGGQRFKQLYEQRGDDKITQREFAKLLFDVRLFGAVIPIQRSKKKKEENEDEGEAFNITGPVQFALLNPSLNEVELRPHQNTAVYVSKEGNKQGSIATTTVVPYAVNQIHGWINPYSAKYTNLSDDDVNIMLKALWESINNANTRTKANQNSLLLLQIVYSDENKKIYGLDRLIKLDHKEKRGEQLRSIDDYDLDLTKLTEKVNSENVQEVRYYTEAEKIENLLNGRPKFTEMVFPDFESNNEAQK